MLAMSVLAAAVLPASLLEDDDFVQPVLGDDGCLDGGARHNGGANGHALVTAQCEHVGEGERRARLGVQLLYLQHCIRSNPVLLSARADHCKHYTVSQNHTGRRESPSDRRARVIATEIALSTRKRSATTEKGGG